MAHRPNEAVCCMAVRRKPSGKASIPPNPSLRLSVHTCDLGKCKSGVPCLHPEKERKRRVLRTSLDGRYHRHVNSTFNFREQDVLVIYPSETGGVGKHQSWLAAKHRYDPSIPCGRMRRENRRTRMRESPSRFDHGSTAPVHLADLRKQL
jgi:hypothetical protein